jgi:Flp pilus assembly protein TadG
MEWRHHPDNQEELSVKYKVPISIKREKNQRGNNLLEFALLSLFLVPAFFGTVSTGMALGKAIQTSQVARDAGHMYVRQVDFSMTQNKNLIVRLANGMGMTLTGGNGVVILTQVLMVGAAECTAAGLSDAQCVNKNWPVITQRLTVGNTGLYTSSIGNPNSNLIGSDGTITPTNYLRESSCRAQTLSQGTAVGLLTLQNAERTYVSEAFFRAPELAFLRRGQTLNLYSRNYF